ncbi:MAG: UDP-glucose 4-epimerase GalE [Bacteroidetes bacterium]|nr:UDP-glucose 4-epimerase GalE [Bacteroidota bacterium]
MNILVTGGIGYIGSHTVVELMNRGYNPIIIDNLVNSDIEVVDRIEKITGKRPVFEKVEMCNMDELRNFFTKYLQIDAVIHFAALLAVNESVEKPLLYYHNNLVSTLNLLQCMQDFNIKDIVFSSSCTVYGEPDILPVDEFAPIKPAMSPYGNTKKICEDILTDTTKVTEIRSILLRYFNPIGAHETALIGEFQDGVPHHLIPYITETASGKREKLRIFGNDYNTPDGTCLRDYIHVVDIAIAHIAAIERLKISNENKIEVFNLGTGIGYSVLDMVNAFENATGIKINYEIVARRPGDVEAVYADTRLANKELNWKAERTLEEMMRSAWEWEKMLGKGK